VLFALARWRKIAQAAALRARIVLACANGLRHAQSRDPKRLLDASPRSHAHLDRRQPYD
jgi:hypothetical protein